MENSTWITAETFPNRIQAELAKGMLEEHGILCRITADDVGGIHPELAFSIGVELKVRQPDLEQAKLLLK